MSTVGEGEMFPSTDGRNARMYACSRALESVKNCTLCARMHPQNAPHHPELARNCPVHRRGPLAATEPHGSLHMQALALPVRSDGAQSASLRPRRLHDSTAGPIFARPMFISQDGVSALSLI